MSVSIFVSWSGAAAQQVAELLKDWIPHVLQNAKIWVSSQDISKGDKWTTQIWESLTAHDYGIVVLTKDNYQAPWILFEAGALSKSVRSKVIPLLCDIQRTELAGSPLAQLQNSAVEKNEMLRILEVFNAADEAGIEAARLGAAFEKWWPDFQTEYDKIAFTPPPTKGKRNDNGPDERLEKIERSVEALLSALNSRRFSGPAGWSFMNKQNFEEHRVMDMLNTLPPSLKAQMLERLVKDVRRARLMEPQAPDPGAIVDPSLKKGDNSDDVFS